MTNDRILDKIKKCLALSKSSNEHEAAAAMRQAQKLMAAHNLSAEQVEVGSISHEYVSSLTTTSRLKPWENVLAHGIKNALGLELLWARGYGNGYGRYIFIGPKSDTEVAKFMWVTLSRKIYNARNTYHSAAQQTWQYDNTERADSYAQGYAQTVVGKLEKFIRPEAHVKMIADAAERIKSNGQAPVQKRELYRGAFNEGAQAGSEVQLRHGMNGSAAQQKALS